MVKVLLWGMGREFDQYFEDVLVMANKFNLHIVGVTSSETQNGQLFAGG